MGSYSEDVVRPVVTLRQGNLRGIIQSEGFPQPVECFLGFPYAQAPVGDLRFRSPAPLHPSQSTFDASQYGYAAPGKFLIAPRISLTYSEDCLFANVFRPKSLASDSNLLPVMIYIHGGAFNRGNSSMQNTASLVAWSADPFIAVSFNYRVGALGFLPSSKSAEEGILNLGLQDQRFLLQWVQDNIQAFGGDKKNITLMGLSAGAISIGHMILQHSDPEQAPFHRAIIQSGSATTRDCRQHDSSQVEQYFEDFLTETRCSQNLSAHDTFAYLRGLPLSDIVNAQDAVFERYKHTMQWAFRPVIDGDIIPRPPLDSWQKGTYLKIPILTGFCTNEGSLYVNPKLSHPDEFTDFMRTLLPSLPAGDLDELNILYPDPSQGHSRYHDDRVNDGIGAQYMRTEAAYGEFALISPVRQTAHLASASEAAPVYLYHWDVSTTSQGGASHADNLPYEAFDRSVVSLSDGQKEVAGVFHAYITSFICNKGDPNKSSGAYKKRPNWEPYMHSRPMTMILGKGNRELVGGAAGIPAELVHETCYDKQCQFWWSRTRVTQQ